MIVAAMLGWLVAMLCVGPGYFRRLHELIARLAEHDPEACEGLGRPSLDILTTQIGSAARCRLMFSFAGCLIPVLLAIFTIRN